MWYLPVPKLRGDTLHKPKPYERQYTDTNAIVGGYMCVNGIMLRTLCWGINQMLCFRMPLLMRETNNRVKDMVTRTVARM
jgi:hypothetical protein